jgi:hypothetical protein
MCVCVCVCVCVCICVHLALFFAGHRLLDQPWSIVIGTRQISSKCVRVFGGVGREAKEVKNERRMGREREGETNRKREIDRESEKARERASERSREECVCVVL